MSKAKTTDERSKTEIAEDVVTPKRMYFVSEYGISVEGDSPSDAHEKAKMQLKKNNENEGGDAE